MSNDLARGLKELADSREAYDEAEGYYSGKVGEFFANRAIEKALSGDGSKKFRMPLAAKAVDIPIDMLEVIAVTTDGGDTVTEALRTRIWDHNDLDSDLIEAFRGAGKLGDFYVTVWPEADDAVAADVADDEDGEDGDTEGARYVEVFLNSPVTMRAIYSRENSRRCLFFIKVWQSDASAADKLPRWRVNLYYRDRIEQYVSAKGSKSRPTDAADFQRYGDEDTESEDSWTIENEYGRFPCFHFRQGSKPHGTPLHSRAYGAQDALTKMNSTLMSTVDFIGYPQRYALVDADATDDATDDEFFEFETSGVIGADTPSGPVTKKKSRLKSGPGETWWLEGVKEVGQFETADSAPFIEGMKFQAKAMALLTDLDRSDFDLDGSGQVPSGESRRVARAGLRAKVRSLIGQYRPVAESMLELAMAMIGYDGVKVSLTFAPLDTTTGLDDWAVIEKKVATGVPLKVALSEAGYPDEKIEEWYPSDVVAVSLTQAKDVAATLASLGTALSLGTATEADVMSLLRPYLPGDRPEPTRPALDEADLDDADEEV